MELSMLRSHKESTCGALMLDSLPSLSLMGGGAGEAAGWDATARSLATAAHPDDWDAQQKCFALDSAAAKTSCSIEHGVVIHQC